MTVQGMNSRDPQSLILITANRLPEQITGAAPLIVEEDINYHNTLHRIDDHDLVSRLIGRTDKGDYVVRGTMDDAYKLGNAIFMEQAITEAAPEKTNVISMLGRTFHSSVYHHTERALKGVREITSAFCTGAGIAANDQKNNAPKWEPAAA